MSNTANMSAPVLIKTALLVPNVHCPSCTVFIDGLLAQLYPPPESVSTSIVSHTVTVRHSPSLKPRLIVEALGAAGYEVQAAGLDGEQDEPFSMKPRWLAKMPWIRRRRALDEETRRRLHQMHCELCRAQKSEEDSLSSQADDKGAADYPTVVVDTPSQPRSDFRATLSISGMTCSSCVRTILETLEGVSWVTTANVTLLTHSASVEFRGERTDATKLINLIEDLGYEASLQDVASLHQESQASAGSDIWTSTYSIEGMTCSACIGTVTEIVKSLDCVQSVDVSLINSSATVVFEGKDNADVIATAIEDAGYGASLNDMSAISANVESHHERRSVSIHIQGMYCEHCPIRIVDALSSFEGRVTIEKPPTLKQPIATISYIPQAPAFTIRAILETISTADEKLTPSIYHPPTLEERARQMHARVQRRVLYRVLLSAITAVPTFIIGIVYMTLVPATNRSRMYLMMPSHGVSRAEWALFAMATPVYFFAADLFHRRTLRELYSIWRPGSSVPMLRRFYRFGSMDMLICLGTTIAYFSSVAELIITAVSTKSGASSNSTTYFDAVVFLTMFLLIGRLIEAYSKAKTGDAVSTLQHLRPREALLAVHHGGEEKDDSGFVSTSVDMIDLTDIVRVVHGGSPPWDGIITAGSTAFDESSLTGESKPVTKTAGDTVYSGTINKGAPVTIKVTRVSGNSMLDQIIAVVREGQARRAPIERVADVLTSYFVPVITLVAIATWVIWLSLGLSGTLPQDYLDIDVGGWPLWSLQFAIAVFVVACPCGIGLATPTALFVGGGLAAKHGILVKGGGEAFQEASRVDVVVFDKTGTLTQGGDPKVTDYQFLLADDSALTERQILAALKHLEGNSSHSIGKAVVDFCGPSEITLKAKNVEEIPGRGMQGSLDLSSQPHSMDILIGNEALLSDHSIALSSTLSTTLDTWKDAAKSIIIVATRTPTSPWQPTALLAVSDAIRPEAPSVISSLAHQGIDVWMLSGDNAKTAAAVGAMVGIPADRVIAGVLPQEKAAKIQYLQRSQVAKRSGWFSGLGTARSNRRAIVAMVGDGVNDSPALTVADVGIAIGSGSDVAISSADFILVKHDLTTLLTLVRLSRVVFRRVKFNFGWALVYNLIALPIAAGCLYAVRSGGGRVRLDPVWASLAMAASSVSVVCSSLAMRSRVPGIGFPA